MINNIFLYIFLTFILRAGGASDPWSQKWLELEDDFTYTFNYTETEGWSHRNVSKYLSVCWLGQEPCQSLSLTSLGGMLKLEH